MALGAQLPVRHDPDTESRFESIAQHTGTTKSALIRMLSKRFVDTRVAEDGSVALPPNILAMLNDGDTRIAPSPKRLPSPGTYRIRQRKKDAP